jgi:hypothetical protein
MWEKTNLLGAIVPVPSSLRPSLFSVSGLPGGPGSNMEAEALLDYILKVDFRNVRWMVISYMTLFFAGTELGSIFPMNTARPFIVSWARRISAL